MTGWNPRTRDHSRRRVPPTGEPAQDHLVIAYGISPVKFGHPIPTDATCHYCGGAANTRDHVVADSVGGSRSWWNLVPACQECNLAKAARQQCSCLFCIRAIALWNLGYLRVGASHRDRKRRRKARDRGEAVTRDV